MRNNSQYLSKNELSVEAFRFIADDELIHKFEGSHRDQYDILDLNID